MPPVGAEGISQTHGRILSASFWKIRKKGASKCLKGADGKWLPPKEVRVVSSRVGICKQSMRCQAWWDENFDKKGIVSIGFTVMDLI